MPDLVSQSEQEFAAQFLDDYYAECDEYLTTVRRNLLALEEDLRAEGVVGRERLQELFRSFHTIKGVSGMVGVHLAEEVAHHMESYLRLLVKGEAQASDDGADALTEGASALGRIIGAHREQRDAPDVEATIARLATLARTEAEPLEADAAEAFAEEEPVDSDAQASRASEKELNEEERARLLAALARGLSAFRFEFTPTSALAARGVNVNSVRALLQELGELVRAAPLISAGASISFEFLLTTGEPETSFAPLASDGVSYRPCPPEECAGAQEAPALERTRGAAEPGPPRGRASDTTTPVLAPLNMVRVELSKLDELMRLVGELVVTRARQEDDLERLEADFPEAAWHKVNETNHAMERQLRDLREGVMRVRLIHIGEAFERMQFVVRDLARECGKRVRVEQSGQSIEIDKFLVERMAEPLLHLVRNAVSHGLETADERERGRKPAVGTLSLRAATAGERVRIEIEDDGRGVDAEVVAARARKLGLLGADAALADESALLEMLCAPGFSTRERADRASGRGVGMDVVRNTVRELGGALALDTEPGRFTRFTVELPLTLSICDALIVAAGGQRFAIPQSSVREVIEVDDGRVTAFGDEEMMRYRGGVLPLMRLTRFFGLAEARLKKLFALVVGDGTRAVGLVVERVSGLREIVVRALTDSLAQVEGVAGATELGDGRLILILDSAALLRLWGERVE